jgi:hypothetical protein
MSRHVFVVTVTGAMDSRLRELFEDVEVTIVQSVTQLRFVSPDPSVLHGVLHRVETFGLELLDVHQIDDAPTP